MARMMNKQEKAEIVGRLLPLVQSCDELAAVLEASVEEGKESPGQKDMEAQLAVMAKEIQELLRRYLEGLPVRDLSRCPFTGEKFSLAIDDLAWTACGGTLTRPSGRKTNFPLPISPWTER
jgi:hypothetical protein